MSRKSLYSVHNALTSRRTRAFHLELNPAVVIAGDRRSYALSVVLVGSRLDNDGASISLSIASDEEASELESIHLRAEPTDGDNWLTVVLFPATRSLLEQLSSSKRVEVRIGTGDRQVVCSLDEEHRGNVLAFMGSVDRENRSADERCGRAGDPGDDDADPIVESVAV